MNDGYRDISTGVEDWGVDAVLTYRGARIGTAGRVEGNLCWINYDNSDEAAPFIWRFPRDGKLNELFNWSGCSADPAAK